MERNVGIEPTSSTWKDEVLPIYQSRVKPLHSLVRGTPAKGPDMTFTPGFRYRGLSFRIHGFGFILGIAHNLGLFRGHGGLTLYVRVIRSITSISQNTAVCFFL
jgi:hypothetical protein